MKTELGQGRVSVVQAEIKRIEFIFINVYPPPPIMALSVQLVYKIKNALQQSSSKRAVTGGDWNGTTSYWKEGERL